MSEELFKRMRELEEWGREIAYHRDEPNYVLKARGLLSSLAITLEKVDNFIQKFIHTEEGRKIATYIDYFLKPAVTLFDRDLFTCQQMGIDKLKDCKISKDTVTAMKLLDENCKKMTGERCVYLSTEPTTSSACVNDITSCFHRLIEYFEKTFGKGRIEEIGDKYTIMKEAGEKERRLLKTWLDAIRKLKEKGFYYQKDWEALHGVALKGKVELRVGSATDHRTHVDVEKNSLRYYDYDYPVNKEMYELWREYANCDCFIVDDGVVCEKCDLEKAMKILAGATSCDIRLDDLEARGLSTGEAIEMNKEKLVEALDLKKKKVEEKVIAGVEWITIRRDDTIIRLPKVWLK